MRNVSLRAAATLTTLALLSCNGGDFDAQTKVTGVRVLSSYADKPYAKPGETVNLELLVADGRTNKKEAVNVLWIPVPCVNPANDLYYLCFTGGTTAAGGAGSGGGTSASPIANLRPGQDLTDFLPKGPKFSFTMPANIIVPQKGGSPYGLVIIFNVACAGRLVLKEVDANAGPQQIPLECTDVFGNALPPSEYVIGFTRVYSYPDRVNQNPKIDGVTFDGAKVDLAKGITVDRCTEKKETDCFEHKFDTQVPASSHEVNTGEFQPNGQPYKEQVWAAYYATDGKFNGDGRLLYDATTGKVDDTTIKFYAPKEPGTKKAWVVVKDNRGGSAWVDFPITVR